MSLLFLLSQHEHMREMAQQASEPDWIAIGDHHLAGVLLIVLAIFAYLERTELARYRWVKFLWPMPLLVLGLFLILFRDTGDPWLRGILHWQIGVTEVQHKLFESVAVVVGLIELFRRTGWLKHPLWPHILNTLMLGAGIFILFHGGQHSHIIHLQHRWMGIVAITLSLTKIVADSRLGGRWLSLYAVPALFLTLGLQFALYVE